MLKKLFLIVLAAVVVYSAVMVYLPWFRNYIFEKDMEEIIREVGYQTMVACRNKVLYTAQQSQVPVTEENLVTTRDEQTGLVTFEAQYSVTVKVAGETYTKVWNFHPRATRVVHVSPGSGTLF